MPPNVATIDVGGNAGKILDSEIAVQHHRVVLLVGRPLGDNPDPKIFDVAANRLENRKLLRVGAGKWADVAIELVGEGAAIVAGIVATTLAQNSPIEVDK